MTLGAFLPLSAAPLAPFDDPKLTRPVIERVEEIRKRLVANEEVVAGGQARLAQWWNNWYNWPNWSNWGGRVARRVGGWRWPGR